LYPQAFFGSNTAVYASNLAVTTSNQVTFTSNAAVFGSNLAVITSNQATFGSNLAVTNSNNLYPRATFASNAAVFGSNTALYGSNTAVWGSNTAVYASNLAYTTSNDIYPLVGGASAWTASGSNVYIIGSNIGINTSTPGSNDLQVNGFVNITSNVYIRGHNIVAFYEYFDTSNYGNFSTTATAYSSNMLTMCNVLEGGEYMFSIYYGQRAANTNRIGMGRVQLSNSLGAAQVIHVNSNSISTNADTFVTDIKFITLPAGSNIFSLQYSANALSTTTVTMRDMRMNLFRVE
jgi:hypothetical protein